MVAVLFAAIPFYARQVTEIVVGILPLALQVSEPFAPWNVVTPGDVFAPGNVVALGVFAPGHALLVQKP